ncbi:hypothetical protein CYMTET_16224 [Cymbomonas tetramitiformis]|uniref:Uncharacterized protein n=1 Tax=Cymbomonas tetramitiformis TaxID=36881 RepID=A0AAE0GDX1_9CHLO|nr:hypothetical protein CYMTET_16224 [Cymbomonas tetramitiformis]
MATLNKLTVHLVSSQGSEEVTATSEAEGTSTEEWKILRTRHYDFFHVGPLSDEAAIASSLWELVKSDLRLPATTAEFYNGGGPRASRICLQTAVTRENPVVYLLHHKPYGNTVRVGRPCPFKGRGRNGGPRAGLTVKSAIRKDRNDKLTPTQQGLALLVMQQNLLLTPEKKKHPLSVSDQPADAMRKFTEGCRECKGLTGVCELTLIRRVATVANKNKDYKKRKARKLSAHFSGKFSSFVA